MNGAFPEPRPAATVVLIRQSDTLPEVFMAKRHSKAVFASHYVFPGGVLDQSDCDAHARAAGVSESEANAMIGVSGGGLDYYSAAIREVFEESAVLLARHADGSWAFGDAANNFEDSRRCRDQLNAGELSWISFIDRHDLHPAYDSLHYFAHWVTPRERERRFSTRFFLAVIPEGQSASHDDRELTDSCWMTANNVLKAGEQGKMKLMYPTQSTLADIALHDSVEDVVEWARQRGASGVARLLPALVDIDGEMQIVLPGEPHYPASTTT